MINSPVAGKALAVVFALLFMAGCSSTKTTDTSAADAEAAAARAAAEAAAAREAEARAAERARMQALQDAVTRAGNVVFFDFDRSEIKPEARQILDAHIALLKTNNDRIRLEGHTDERGTREYNMALGERRANSVADYMAANGIARSRVETVSFGEERPVAMGSNEGAWSQNRRVEIKRN
jgi:peptidoglycan-associated lipoprotein